MENLVVEYVAVASPSLLSNIKQQLVLFDRVAVVHGNIDWDFREDNPGLGADLDWLENQGIVFRVTDFLDQGCGLLFSAVEKGQEPQNLRLRFAQLPKYSGHGQLILHAASESERIELDQSYNIHQQFPRQSERLSPERNTKITFKELMEGMDDLACRSEAQRLTASMSVHAVSLSSPHSLINELLSVETGPGDVIRVSVRNMPEPSDTTSLEEIIRFRQDPESKNKMVALRRWLRTMMTKGLPEKKLNEELEWLVHQYEEHMRFHELKFKRGILEIVVTIAAEIAEDLVKIRLGELSRLPFTLSHRKIDLLQAELNAPGREIAYVVHARKQFSE
jgi:hypothetical protein